MPDPRTLDHVKQYYGKVLASNKDLQTSACCTAEAMPPHLRPLLADVHPEVQSPHGFVLDDHHHFRTGMPHLVCSNTAAMLAGTRYARHFKIAGDTSTHYGLFDCAPSPAPGAAGPTGACC